MQFVSWLEGEAQPPVDSPYFFDDSNGNGATVYILDTGANLGSPVPESFVMTLLTYTNHVTGVCQ